MTLEPKKDELFGSFIERVATLNEISSYELVRHILGDEASKISTFSILFFDENGKAKFERLAKALHAGIETIQSVAIPKKFLRYDKNDFSLQSACKDIKLGRSVYDPVLRPSWCPQCLFEEVLGGIDQYLRREWALSWRTICPKHLRPLNERCTNCYAYFEIPMFQRHGKAVRIHCPNCYAPLDGQLGYDFLTARHSADWMNNHKVQEIWRKLAAFENYCINGRGKKNIYAKSYVLAGQFTSLMNVFLFSSKYSRTRLIDLLECPWFPTRPIDRFGSEDIEAPFCVACLTERRKAMALLMGWILNDFKNFGFNKREFNSAIYDRQSINWDIKHMMDQFTLATIRLANFF